MERSYHSAGWYNRRSVDPYWSGCPEFFIVEFKVWERIVFITFHADVSKNTSRFLNVKLKSTQSRNLSWKIWYNELSGKKIHYLPKEKSQIIGRENY